MAKHYALPVTSQMNYRGVFIDESGDFGECDPKSPFYIITMLFHDNTSPLGNAQSIPHTL